MLRRVRLAGRPAGYVCAPEFVRLLLNEPKCGHSGLRIPKSSSKKSSSPSFVRNAVPQPKHVIG